MAGIAMWLPAILLFSTTALSCKHSSDDVIVSLNHGGKIRGTILTSEKGKPFYAFRGIPYAEAPVGQLRFKAPLPKTSWNEDSVFDAMEDGQVCFQKNDMDFVGEEDCLNLNVYTPVHQQNNSADNRKSVMIFIPGGGFTSGSGTSAKYPPGRLMDSDIVLVTINYRLDALGFLSTGDSSSPGNYGLLDQTLSFQWVKDNIEVFGGNKESVTIFGQSAGGTSTSYHLISPLSKGLFQRAIIMSGSDVAPYYLATDPLFWAKYLASQTGCPQNSTSAMVKCFRSKPAKELVLGEEHYEIFSSFIVPFAPTVDGYFLSAPPREILAYSPDKINHVPVLCGSTEMESAGIVAMMEELKPNVSMISDEGFDYLFNNSVSNQNINIINMIKDQYLKGVDVTNEFEANKAVVKALSDSDVMTLYEEVNFLSKAGLVVYLYSYDYATTNTFEPFASEDRRYGVGHAEDLTVLFNFTQFGGIHFEENDFKMVDIMTEIWTNFAKTGNPDPTDKYLPKWEPSSPDVFHIHHLNLTITLEDKEVNNDEVFEFWTKTVAAARNNTMREITSSSA